MALTLVLVPLGFALAALVVRSDRMRPWLVTAGSLVHFVLVAFALASPAVAGLGGWLLLDAFGRIVLGVTSLIFVACGAYVPAYLAERADRPNRVFCACMLAFMGALTLITEAHHLGLMWVAMESCTLAAAPLLYFDHNSRSLEATWKYLLLGSVGIAMALLGSFFLGYAALYSGGEPSLLLADLVENAPRMSRSWLHAAFVVLLVGYGTKMGLAPMHTWKPDAYGEAPGVAGALLAGGLTSGAFLAILRVYRICAAAGEAEFAQKPLIVLGLASMLVAGIFMARQRDYKRMLAYSSVEHMGILVLGVGIGGGALFGSLLHLVNNGLTKGVMFLAAGNIHRAFGSKKTDDVRGAFRRLPVSATLLFLGFLAATGSPPFGPFLSEFTILNAAVSSGKSTLAGLFLLMLAIVFVGMSATVLAVVQGDAAPSETRAVRERTLSVAPAIVLLALVLLLGVYVPGPLASLLRAAAASLEGP